jgi:hypothetical protein
MSVSDVNDARGYHEAWVRLGLVALPLSAIAYVFGFWMDVGGTSKWFSLAFPPALLIASIALAHHFSHGARRPVYQIAIVFTALATATFLIMITAQWGIRSGLLEEYKALSAGSEKDAALWALRAVDQMQLSFDIAWDIWISGAATAFGAGLIRYRVGTSELLLGVLGVLAGTVGLAINFYAFPVPPSQIGLPDPGAFFFVWYVVAAISLFRAALNGRKT